MAEDTHIPARTQKLDEVLVYYKAFASELLDDIALLQADSKFVEKGGKIHYAIDFSEIYAYCVRAPDSFFANAPKGAWEDGVGRTSLVEIHESILQFILFNATDRLILLDPYSLELASYYRRLRSQVVKEETRRVARALGQMEKQRAREALSDLEKLAATRQDGDQVTLARAGDLIDNALPFIQAEADRARPPDTLSRLVRLLDDKRLVLLSELTRFNTEPDEKITEQWSDVLNKHRRERVAQNALDAEAMGTLLSTNRQLLKENPPRLIRLVTRSPRMNAIMREERYLTPWADVGGNPLRTPRGFLTVFNENARLELHSEPQRQLQNLDRWRVSFERLAGRAPSADELAGNLTESEIIRRQVAIITTVWRRYCSFHAAQFSLSNAQPADVLADEDIGALQNLIADVILKLRRDLDKAHTAMQTLLPGEVANKKNLARVIFASRPDQSLHRAPVESDARVLLFTPHGTPLPFSLFLNNRRLRTEMRDRANNATRVLTLLVDDTRTDGRFHPGEDLSNSEWYLALAYANAAIGAWLMTESAIAAAKQELDVVANQAARDLIEKEIIYFEAKVVRHLEKPIQEMEEILSEIEQMADRQPRTGTEHDRAYGVRMRSEAFKLRFTLIKRQLEERPDDIHLHREAGVRTIQHAQNILKLARPGVDRCDLLNNMTYHAAQLESLGVQILSLPRQKQNFERFEKEVKKYYGSESEWPDNFADTVAWVRLRLMKLGEIKPEVPLDDAEKIMNDLKKITRNIQASPYDLRDFRAHAEEASSYFLALEAGATKEKHGDS
jgi:hypothetical protein